MKHFKILIICCMFLPWFYIPLAAQEIREKPVVNISNNFTSAKFKKNEFSISQIFSNELNQQYFRELEPYGLGESDYIYWYKGKLSANSSSKKQTTKREQYIEIPYAMLGKVNIWFPTTSGKTIHYRGGVEYPFSERVVEDGSFVFPVPSTLSPSTDIIISIESSSSISFSVLLWDKKSWYGNRLNTKMWYGFFFGCLAALMFYNLFLSIALKDKSYIFYICYLVGLAGINAAGAGLLDQYLWPNVTGNTERSFQFIIAVTIVFDTLFINHFLEIDKQFPKTWRFSNLFMVLIVLFSLPELFGYTSIYSIDEILISLVIFLTNIAILYYLMVSILSYKRGVIQARFVVVAFSLLLINYVIYRLYTFQIIEYGFIIRHLLEVGTLAEGLFLSLALADRINLLSLEKDRFEKKSLLLSQSMSKKLIYAQEVEREAVSDAMHATVGQSLLVLKQQLGEISLSCKNKQPTNCQKIKKSIQEQAKYCGEILDEVRALSQDLHPHVLKNVGLKQAIEAIFQTAFSQCTIEWQSDIDDKINKVDSQMGITIYRVIQEYLNQVQSHQNISEIFFSIKIRDDQVNVNIKDDGDVEKSMFEHSHRQNKVIALERVKGQIKLFDGKFDFRSSPDLGSQLFFSIPILPLR